MFRLSLATDPAPTASDLAAEAVAVKIRWFGLVVGYLYANFGSAADPGPIREIWMGVHADLRHMPRIRAVIDALDAAFAQMKQAFAGTLAG